MSHDSIREAQRYIPGGVNSPVRSFAAVGGDPVFFVQGEGATLTDTDGRRYLDYVGSWGPMIAGHSHPEVLHAVRETIRQGLSFGAPHPLETEMARTLCARIPSLEKVRMVNSGTEAAMSALRLARGATGRPCILKFAGCYHGHADALLVQAGSGALTHGTPSSPGIPEDTVRHTMTADYNDVSAVQRIFSERGGEIAAVIVEPIAGNMGCVLPQPGFLEALRACCTEHGSILIFDEVMTGFRVAAGGAQERLGIRPDLTILGKVIGGGLPVGAFGGRADLMDELSPLGSVYQAGTLSGNPVTLAAGLATLRLTEQPGFYEHLERLAQQLATGLQEQAEHHGVTLQTVSAGGMFGMFFSDRPVCCHADLQYCRTEDYRVFFHRMLEAGIYFAPSPYESGFLSMAHTEGDVERTLDAAGQALQDLRDGGTPQT